MLLYIRAETRANEYRTPLVPEDVARLIAAGHTCLVQTSETRCFTDVQYRYAGATVVNEPWYSYPTALIIGLKELDHLDQLNYNTHLFFSHSRKGQEGAQRIIDAFANSQSLLYDLEYLTEKGKRLVSFGYYAGLVGTVLGLRQYYNKEHALPDIANLRPWTTYADILSFYRPTSPRVVIVGDGKSSKGAQHILDTLGLTYTVKRRGEEVDLTCDMLINCITLDPSFTNVWIPTVSKQQVIVDISCDYAKENNPLPFYKEATTWETPVYRWNEVSLIAIDNLPSLLPRESSIEFSRQLTPLIDNYGDDTWERAL
jgi:saccharopine dehydrogenase (NAD+, L-lysine-forming)